MKLCMKHVMLEHQLRDFHDYVLRVRKKTLSENNRGTASNKEHKYILEAIKSGDPKKAEEEAEKARKKAESEAYQAELERPRVEKENKRRDELRKHCRRHGLDYDTENLSFRPCFSSARRTT